MLTTRASLDAQHIRQASLSIETKLINLPAFIAATHIALYVPTQGEVDLLALTTLADKQFYLPRMTAQRSLTFAPYVPGQALVTNHYGIAEPAETVASVPVTALDIILLPLVAFDAEGNRLGRGSGYYDRTLAFMLEPADGPRPHLIGVAYDFQKVDALSRNAWDVPLHQVVTETQLYPGEPA